MNKILRGLISLIILIGLPLQVLSATATYPVSGTISGLVGSATLKLNGGSALTLKGVGKALTFKFSQATALLAVGKPYTVTVIPPTTQACTITAKASGTMIVGSVKTVAISCAYKRNIAGTIVGLKGSLTLANNNGPSNKFTSTGATIPFKITNPAYVAQGTKYSLTIVSPFNQKCTVSAPTGVVGVSNTANLTISCTIINPYVAYITTSTQIIGCALDSNSKTQPNAFGTCQTLSSTTGANSAVLNKAKTRAYLVNNSVTNSIIQCTITTSNGAWSNCVNSSTSFNGPTGIALSADGSHAYVSSSGTTAGGKPSGGGKSIQPAIEGIVKPTVNIGISYCSLDSQGNLASCVSANSGLSSAAGLILNSAGTRAYVTTANGNALSVYNIDPQTGFLSKASNGDANLAGLNAAALNLVKGTTGTYLYMSNLMGKN